MPTQVKLAMSVDNQCVGDVGSWWQDFYYSKYSDGRCTIGTCHTYLCRPVMKAPHVLQAAAAQRLSNDPLTGPPASLIPSIHSRRRSPTCDCRCSGDMPKSLPRAWASEWTPRPLCRNYARVHDKLTAPEGKLASVVPSVGRVLSVIIMQTSRWPCLD